MSTRNLFKLLNLEPTGDKRALRRAYSRAIKDAHPDYGGSTSKVQKIINAFNVLKQQSWTINTTIPIDLKTFLTGDNLNAIVKSETETFLVNFDVPPFTDIGSIIEVKSNGYLLSIKLTEKESKFVQLGSTIMLTVNIPKDFKGDKFKFRNFDDTECELDLKELDLGPHVNDVKGQIFPGKGFFRKSKNRGDLLVFVEEK